MYIDAPTPIQEMVENVVMKFHPNGEPTFESLGLGGWSPSGIVQNFLEFMHISLDMPWWVTIVTGILSFIARFIDSIKVHGY